MTTRESTMHSGSVSERPPSSDGWEVEARSPTQLQAAQRSLAAEQSRPAVARAAAVPCGQAVWRASEVSW